MVTWPYTWPERNPWFLSSLGILVPQNKGAQYVLVATCLIFIDYTGQIKCLHLQFLTFRIRLIRVIVLRLLPTLACEQAPGEPELSEGACRHSIYWCRCSMIPAPGIMIWLVKSLIVDNFEINTWQIFVNCGWPPYTTPTAHGNCAFDVLFLFSVSRPFIISQVILKGTLCSVMRRNFK